MPVFSARQLADRFDGTLLGDPDVRVSGLAGLEDATPADLAFLGNDRYVKFVAPSAAGIILVPAAWTEAPPADRAYVAVANVSAAFSEMVRELRPAPYVPAAGVHPRAVIDPTAYLGANVHVGANAVIEADVEIGAGTLIEAGCYLGPGARVGRDCRLYPNVTVRDRCLLGDRVILQPGVVVGGDGFGFEPHPDGHRKIPQLGIVQIDDDVEIGANSTVDRARFGRTWIKTGAKIDNLVMIAHNVIIGRHCFVVAQVGIAGSTVVGDGVTLAGQVGVAGHLRIGDRAVVMGRAAVWADVEPGAKVAGEPARDRREYLRRQALIDKLPELYRQLRDLEKGSPK